MTPQSLLRFLQEAAANHAEILRVGGEELVEQDLMWVLSRLRLKMHRTPKWHDDITVETWPSKRTKGVRAHRDFRIIDGAGAELGVASSMWLLLSRKNRRPVRIPEFLDQSRWPGLEEDLLVDSEVESFVDEEYRKDFDVCVTHLDFNNHVNNVCYLEWALNSLPVEIFESCILDDILLNFLAEAPLDDVVTTRSKTLANESPTVVFAHNLQRRSDGQAVAAMRTTWVRRDSL